MSNSLSAADPRPTPACMVSAKHGPLRFKGVHPDQESGTAREHWKCDKGRCSVFYTRPAFVQPQQPQP